MCNVQSLVEDLLSKAAALSNAEQYWVGIAGAPGSGKSTLAAELLRELGDIAVVIPMDGYHLFRHELDRCEDPVVAYARRGAPFTFNAKRFVEDLKQARRLGDGSFPGFDHGVGDPVENSVRLERSQHRIVIVEGNYLLLDEVPWCELKQDVFDETWFLDVPVEECRRRVYQRHIATGKAEQVARRRVDNNDGPNAELVTTVSPKNADRVIRLH